MIGVRLSIDGAEPIDDLEQVICDIGERWVVGFKKGGYWFEPAGDWSVIALMCSDGDAPSPWLYYNGSLYPCVNTISNIHATTYVYHRHHREAFWEHELRSDSA